MNRPTLYDDEAEHHCAGIATISTHGAELIADRLGPDDFHDPLARRVIAAAVGTPDDLPGDNPDPIDRRIDTIATIVDMYPALLRDWVAHTPAMWDTDGQIANRVRVAADRRRTARALVAALEALGLKVEWDVAA